MSGRNVTRFDFLAGLCVFGRVIMLLGRVILEPHNPTRGRSACAVGFDHKAELPIDKG